MSNKGIGASDIGHCAMGGVADSSRGVWWIWKFTVGSLFTQWSLYLPRGGQNGLDAACSLWCSNRPIHQKCRLAAGQMQGDDVLTLPDKIKQGKPTISVRVILSSACLLIGFRFQ